MAVAVSLTDTWKVYYGTYGEVTQALADNKVPASSVISINNNSDVFYAFVKFN